MSALVISGDDSKVQHRVKGLILAAIGFIIVSPEVLLIRLIKADLWTILFWRGILSAVGLAILASVGARAGGVWRRFAAVGRMGILVIVLNAMSQMLFIISALHTTAANTLVILTAAPLSAAVMSRVFLKELVLPSTWVAVGVVTTAAFLILQGSIGGGTLLGDLAAVLATVGFAGTLTALRRARDINMIPAMAMAALLAGVLSLSFADPLAITIGDMRLLLLMGAIVVPVGALFITSAPKFISAAEVGLVVPLEAVLGPVWVWLALGEFPSTATIVAGAVILATLMVHSIVVGVLPNMLRGPHRARGS